MRNSGRALLIAVPILWIAATAVAATAGLSAITPVGQSSGTACDRECLRGFMTNYLKALIAHKPGDVPVASTARFTEDTVERKLGEGLWTTASELTEYRQDILDTRQGVAGTHVIIKEAGKLVMLLVRLKVVDRKITEIETQVTRSASDGGLFNPNALKTPSAAMNLTPPKDKLNTREEATRIALLYPAGLKAGSFVTVDAPFAPDAYRFENGSLMAGPGCTRGGCENIKTQRITALPEVASRVAAVDAESGIVWIRMDFGTGALANSRPGMVFIVWEMFKVYGGQIHAVEAFMRIMPHGTPSGWDAK